MRIDSEIWKFINNRNNYNTTEETKNNNNKKQQRWKRQRREIKPIEKIRGNINSKRKSEMTGDRARLGHFLPLIIPLISDTRTRRSGRRGREPGTVMGYCYAHKVTSTSLISLYCVGTGGGVGGGGRMYATNCAK